METNSNLKMSGSYRKWMYELNDFENPWRHQIKLLLECIINTYMRNNNAKLNLLEWFK